MENQTLIIVIAVGILFLSIYSWIVAKITMSMYFGSANWANRCDSISEEDKKRICRNYIS